jgi:outer membrane protein insertion porin family
MKKTLLSLLLSFCLSLNADLTKYDSFEKVHVEEITVTITNNSEPNSPVKEKVLTQIALKKGDLFNQSEFDKDLHLLSKKYQSVDPEIKKYNGKLYIHLNITLRPTIVKFIVNDTVYSTKKILDKGDLKAPMEYNRAQFYQSITDIRDFLIKRGYFKADVSYKVEEIPGTQNAIAHITVNAGPLGHINDIEFIGFTKEEKSAVYGMIKTSKFNILTNWLTGSGILRDADKDRDQQAITQYIQNEGYIDAKVEMILNETEKNKLSLTISLQRGPLYRIGAIKIKGNTLESSEALSKNLLIKEGDVFSAVKIYHTQEQIKNVYTKQGYLDTSVNYELIPQDDLKYTVVYTVEESEKYKVGLIVVSGNTRTDNNVIYQRTDIVPGEVFDASKMKSTQQRLQASGYFKNVSVYAIKSDHLQSPDNQYRDVRIEVEENRTANFHLSAGANSTTNIFGEISLTENNFDLSGLTTFWTEGVNGFRGAGQYFDLKGMFASKEQSATLSWINPYMNDSLWRLGIDVQGKKDSTVSTNYDLYSIGGGVSAIYPINPYFSSGVKWRFKDSLISIINTEETIAIEQERNSGIVSGVSLVFGYNSTDNPFVPRKGLKSNFETEFAGLVRNSTQIQDFPFVKFSYLNSLYFPLWPNATFKLRGDLKYSLLLMDGQSDELPFTEKFFAGGIGTLRGYAPQQIGPYFSPNNPKGGIASEIFSAELLQKIIQPLDVFAFFDTGSISDNPFKDIKFYSSVGVGLRLNIGQAMPFVIGYGYPINPDNIIDPSTGKNPQVQRIFFSMAGQF